jgi:hypothetical protein
VLNCCAVVTIGKNNSPEITANTALRTKVGVVIMKIFLVNSGQKEQSNVGATQQIYNIIPIKPTHGVIFEKIILSAEADCNRSLKGQFKLFLTTETLTMVG